MFAVGASALRNGLSPSADDRSCARLGSPRQVFRSLPRAVGKFSTTSTLEVLDLGRTHASMRYELHDGYAHSRLDCLYAQGLFSVVPTIFGLPEARIVHDECESDGYPACLYHGHLGSPVALAPQGRAGGPGAGGAAPAARRAAVGGHATWSAATHVEDVLQRITERAASAVLAPAYLLAVEQPPSGEPLVFSSGLDPAQADELAGRAARRRRPGAVRRRRRRRLDPPPPRPARRAATARARPVWPTSSGCSPSTPGTPPWRSTCSWPSRGSRRGEERATALLGLSHQLATASSSLRSPRS